MHQWLLIWKKIYAKTKRLNLSDVQKDRCAYDFLNALRTMNLSFVSDKETILNHEMNQRKSSTSIRNILKEFRNHLRIAWTLITKKTTHETFATLQKKLRMRRRLIKKNQRNSRIEDSRIARSRNDLAYVTKSIYSKIVIIWSRKFARINKNRIKKSKRKSTKFSNRIRSFESQSNTLRKKSKNDLKKKKRSRMTSTTKRDRWLRNSSTMKWF
jgi:hypothetical protein